MKRRLLNYLLKSLFNAVTEDDVIKQRGEMIYRDNKPLSNMEIEELKNGAEALKSMEVWKQLVAEMKWVANKRIYNESVTTDDLTFPKAVLFVVDVMTRKIESLSKLK